MVWNTIMAAVSLFWNTNMAVVTSWETLSTCLIVEQYNYTYLVVLE